MRSDTDSLCLMPSETVYKNVKANASLIAAAPDLLKAVRAWDAAFRSFCGDPDMFLDTFDSARSLSRSAIAKAESEATDVGR